jgi:hypothetical protein
VMTLCPKVIIRRELASIDLGPSSCRPFLELLKLIDFLAFKSLGFKHVEFDYIYVNVDPSMAGATKQAIEFTEGFRYSYLSSILGEDVGAAVLDHRDNRVPVQAVRRWHEALIKAVETIGEDFARKLV